jgi:hypothetical protein
MMISRTRLAFLVLLFVAGGTVLIDGVRAGGGHYFPPVTDAPTLAECTACHIAYPAGLLPAASWQRIMGDLGNHFGDDASLDDATRESITAYLVANAADTGGREWGRRMLRGVDPANPPLRITELPRWEHKHDEVPAREWKSVKVKSRANCGACHADAAQGYFEED